MFTPLLDGARQPAALEFPPAALSVWPKGSLLLITAGAVDVCGADPAEISGVAADQHGPDVSGFNILASHDVPPGTVHMFPVKGHKFLADYTGALPATLGGAYGVAALASGEWVVDFGEIVATRLTLEAWGTANEPGAARRRVVVKFLDANCTEL